MPNFDKKPDGMPYDQWLREKGVTFKIAENPLSVRNHLKNKPHEAYDRALARQGKPLDPEDIGEG